MKEVDFSFLTATRRNPEAKLTPRRLAASFRKSLNSMTSTVPCMFVTRKYAVIAISVARFGQLTKEKSEAETPQRNWIATLVEQGTRCAIMRQVCTHNALFGFVFKVIVQNLVCVRLASFPVGFAAEMYHVGCLQHMQHRDQRFPCGRLTDRKATLPCHNSSPTVPRCVEIWFPYSTLSMKPFWLKAFCSNFVLLTRTTSLRSSH